MTMLFSGQSLPLTLSAGQSLVLKDISGTSSVTGSTVTKEDATTRIGAGFSVYGPQSSGATLTLSTTGQCDWQVVNGDATPPTETLRYNVGNNGPAFTGDDARALGTVLVTRRGAAGTGVFNVTGTTIKQFYEIADLSKLTLETGDELEIDVHFTYTSSTNNKVLGFAFGPNTSSITEPMTTTRAVAGEVSLRGKVYAMVVSATSLLIHRTMNAPFGPSTAATTEYTINPATDKLYITMILSSAGENISINGVTVLHRKARA